MKNATERDANQDAARRLRESTFIQVRYAGGILARLRSSDRLFLLSAQAIAAQMLTISRRVAAWALLAACALLPLTPLHAQSDDDDAVLLVAHPAFRDADYRQTVLIAAPAPSGGHIGVILNRPTKRSLFSLFPEHEPSKQVKEPVYYGGPFSRSALVALVRRQDDPGEGTVFLMKNLYLAFRVTTIDEIIETTPNEARYYVGYVAWRPGELRSELDRGLWSVLGADIDTVFRKDTDGLWEELLTRTRRLRAGTAYAPLALRYR
jgi:putative transcriptional regulator